MGMCAFSTVVGNLSFEFLTLSGIFFFLGKVVMCHFRLFGRPHLPVLKVDHKFHFLASDKKLQPLSLRAHFTFLF